MKFGKKVCNIEKDFLMKPVYNDQYLNYIKNYLKVYNKKINADFCGNKIPKKNSQCICLSVILLFSVFTMGINYYSQVFLEKFKYVIIKQILMKKL